MFTESAEWYDLIYGSFKDYAGESARIADLLEQLHPDARTVLDVGCGTGEHARHLRESHGFEVDGIDVEEAFVRRAREKNRGGRFVRADMADFDLGRRYDVVLCLFSSIGYLRTPEALEGALRCFRDHLAAGGVAVVEPWIAPEAWETGRVFVHTAEEDEVAVCRMSHSSRRGDLSVIEFHYLVGRPGGIEHLTETHEMALLPRDALERAFGAAGFTSVERDPEGLIGRGLVWGREGGTEPGPQRA